LVFLTNTKGDTSMDSNLTLSPSETLSLWNVYLTETMTTFVTQYFLAIATAEDKELIKVLEFALKISQEGVKISSTFLKNANHPLPQGFTEEDVNVKAPKVYSDHFIILLKNKLVQDALVVNTMALGSSSRTDIRNFFEKQLTEGAKLNNMMLELIHKRGLHHPLHIPFPEHIEKVKSSFLFLGGIFEGNRPLNTAEIFNLVLNFQAAEAVSIIFKSFAQFKLTKEQKLEQHFQRGAEIMDKHLQLFQSRLSEGGLPQLPTWESQLTDSTVSPFSDRLMLFKSAVLLSATAGRYGVALSTVMRKDIGTDFMRLMTETLKYAEDTMNLMIKKGYFDQHPMATKHQK
jgi:hypothetical protein